MKLAYREFIKEHSNQTKETISVREALRACDLAILEILERIEEAKLNDLGKIIAEIRLEHI